MDNNILDIILNTTFTQAQLKKRVRLLKSYLLNILFKGSSQTNDLSVEDIRWIKSLPDSLMQQFNKDNVYSIFENLEKQINELKPLTLYLAFEADEKTLQSIGTFARKTFNKTLILDIKVDPSLISGAALVWKGIYKDYSLKSKLAEKRVEISQSFKRFLR